MEENVVYWIWLSLVCGPASKVPGLLLREFGSIENIYSAKAADYRAAGIHESLITALCDKDLVHAQAIQRLCEQRNIGILTMQNPLYPKRLRRIADAPAVLYFRGFLPTINNLMVVAVVGTRAMTDKGRKMTYQLAYDLALSGALIISGMALGVDGTAQTAALDAGGKTLAILGTAIDRCYPKEHLPLYNRLILDGGILSEYTPGTETQGWSFPQRNRIISGLCQAVLVTEGNGRSGALITAKHAMVQGRDVFAVPGAPDDPSFEGTNLLLKNGAHAVTSASDIFHLYGNRFSNVTDPSRIGKAYFYQRFDDRLRYGKDAIDRRLAGEGLLSGPEPSPRSAPAELPLREERYTDEAPETPSPRTPAPPQTSSPAEEEQPASVSAGPVPEKEPIGEPAPVSPRFRRPLSDEEQKILSLLDTKRTADDLAALGLNTPNILSALTMLEIDGFVRSLPGGMYLAVSDD